MFHGKWDHIAKWPLPFILRKHDQLKDSIGNIFASRVASFGCPQRQLFFKNGQRALFKKSFSFSRLVGYVGRSRGSVFGITRFTSSHYHCGAAGDRFSVRHTHALRSLHHLGSQFRRLRLGHRGNRGGIVLAQCQVPCPFWEASVWSKQKVLYELY